MWLTANQGDVHISTKHYCGAVKKGLSFTSLFSYKCYGWRDSIFLSAISHILHLLSDLCFCWSLKKYSYRCTHCNVFFYLGSAAEQTNLHLQFSGILSNCSCCLNVVFSTLNYDGFICASSWSLAWSHEPSSDFDDDWKHITFSKLLKLSQMPSFSICKMWNDWQLIRIKIY